MWSSYATEAGTLGGAPVNRHFLVSGERERRPRLLLGRRPPARSSSRRTCEERFSARSEAEARARSSFSRGSPLLLDSPFARICPEPPDGPVPVGATCRRAALTLPAGRLCGPFGSNPCATRMARGDESRVASGRAETYIIGEDLQGREPAYFTRGKSPTLTHGSAPSRSRPEPAPQPIRQCASPRFSR